VMISKLIPTSQYANGNWTGKRKNERKFRVERRKEGKKEKRKEKREKKKEKRELTLGEERRGTSMRRSNPGIDQNQLNKPLCH